MGCHYVPRAYLNGFCIPGTDRLWVYDKQDDRFFATNVKNVAQENGFFSPEVENDLARLVEQPANPALAKLRAGQTIDQHDRARLSIYLATTLKRVPHHRKKSFASLPEILTKLIRETKDGLDAVAEREEVDQ